ncbi:WD40-repeat-containing domain protein [Piptocephalis cylindrospora]|uniref:WD repeat-containing protein JIP5 n=1 Tax=Piptocephalis cylindrospora TaxID=1907219 RepID=A0A4P9Y892_9FUNG|nr:WD40-repeat-containing domain protein [Piptocephalis cylindrospora]|eukprot:RKP15012.1 WD40-repeat-containing domain protein [Piptocephalis cylindrospora]
MSTSSSDDPPGPRRIFELGDQALEVATHPSSSLFAASLINGEVVCLSYPPDPDTSSVDEEDSEKGQEAFRIKEHKKSCRSLDFSMDGADRSWNSVDVSTGKIIHSELRSHEKGINRIRCLNERMIATGDDDGVVKIWDQRTHQAVQTYHDNEDFISSFAFQPQKKQLLAAGGDGYLSVFDIRKPNLVARSDNLDDELLSVQIIKNGKKVVVGTQDGVLAFFTYGNWGDINDRFVGHPSSVDALCKVDEDTVLSGSSDGLIRVCGLLPNRMYGVVGAQDMPVECLTMDHSRQWLLSLGHDDLVRFWDVKFLTHEEDEQCEEQGDTLATGEATESKKRSVEGEPQDVSKPGPANDLLPSKKKKKAARIEAKERTEKAVQDQASFFSDL